MKSQQGFATILFLSLVPLLVAAGLGVLFCFSFLKADMAVLNVCRAGQLEIQNKVAQDLTKLLGLNAKALQLRAQKAAAEVRLEAAIAFENPLAIAAATAHLLKIQGQQAALDLRQKILIERANIKFIRGDAEISKELSREWQQQTRALAPWLSLQLRLGDAKVPHLAVRPDIPEVAPAYELVPQFEETQSWAQSWQLQLQTKAWLKVFLNFGGRFERSCSTSIYKDRFDWIAKMKQVRSLSKPW